MRFVLAAETVDEQVLVSVLHLDEKGCK